VFLRRTADPPARARPFGPRSIEVAGAATGKHSKWNPKPPGAEKRDPAADGQQAARTYQRRGIDGHLSSVAGARWT